jgi:hypothetical protein
MGSTQPRGTGTFYWPVPVTANVSTLGFAVSVTVTALARVPTALGVKVTVKVHFA